MLFSLSISGHHSRNMDGLSVLTKMHKKKSMKAQDYELTIVSSK